MHVERGRVPEAHCGLLCHSLGVRIRCVLTDNGSAFRSRAFAKACRCLGLERRFTCLYSPQTNGKAERFIQSALREWAYGIAYNHSSERAAMLERWRHHYNWHHPHQGIGDLAPISRLAHSRNNLLILHNREPVRVTAQEGTVTSQVEQRRRPLPDGMVRAGRQALAVTQARCAMRREGSYASH